MKKNRVLFTIVLSTILSYPMYSHSDPMVEDVTEESQSHNGKIYYYSKDPNDEIIKEGYETFLSDLKRSGKWTDDVKIGYPHRDYGRFPYAIPDPYKKGWLAYVSEDRCTYFATKNDRVVSAYSFRVYENEYGKQFTSYGGSTGTLTQDAALLSIVRTLEKDTTLTAEYELCTVRIFFKTPLIWLKGEDDHKFIPLQDIDILKSGQMYTEEDVGLAIKNIEEKARNNQDL